MRAQRFKFVKDFVHPDGTLKKDSTITILGEHVFFNDVQVHPVFYKFLTTLVEEELKKPNYLREVNVSLSMLQPRRQGI